jgi:hypothetical protein
MPIQFACPHCGRGFQGPDHYRGIFTVCPSCRQQLQIPLDLPVLPAIEDRPVVRSLRERNPADSASGPRRQEPPPIDAILRKHWDAQPGSLLYRRDLGIPRQLLRGAIAAYGGGTRSEDVLALFDNSLLETGKAGWFFTAERLLYSETPPVTSAGSERYHSIRSASIDHGTVRSTVELTLDGDRKIYLGYANALPLGPVFVEVFREVAKLHQPDA